MHAGSLVLLGIVAVSTLTAGTPEGAARESNALTKAEAAEGWLLLFDGESLFGWKAVDADRWNVVDGAMTCEAPSPAGIQTTTEFADSILRFQYRRSPGGKGAVGFRVTATSNSASSGYEVRIDDGDAQTPTGSLVGIAPATPPDKKATAAADAWHDIEIRAEGDHLQVVVDGRKVADARDASHRRGVIALRSGAGQRLQYRGLRLKPLLSTSLFNGKDLSGWWLLPNTMCKASVQDGTLNLRSGKGQIETVSQWKDFVLQLEIRTGAVHTNSGVFFRGEPRQRWNGYESQILNKWLDDDRSKPEDYGTGAIYNRQSARRVYADDLEWFTMTIVAHGNHMATWVNGHQAADFTDNRPPNRNGRYGQKTGAGVISLQGHDLTGSLSFRNIRIAEYAPIGP
jgi:hypothetical protein